MKKSLVVFDLDGTLLNTIDDLGHAANYALEKNGLPTHPIESYPRMVGNGVVRLLERTLPPGCDPRVVEESLLSDFKEYYNGHNTVYTAPYPGIIDLLGELAEAGVSMAVASNKYQAATEKIISHYFPKIPWVAVEGQREGIPVKPDPSVVFCILASAKVSKAETIYVGDSGVDMETARRACVDSVGVTWGFRSRQELIDYNAGRIVDTTDEILSLIL